MAGKSKNYRGKSNTVLAKTRERRELRRTRTAPLSTPAVERHNAEPIQTDIPAHEATNGPEILDQLASKRSAAVARITELALLMEKEITDLGSLDSVMGLYDPTHVPWRAKDLTGVVGSTSARPEPSTNGHDLHKEGSTLLERFFGNDDRTTNITTILRKSRKPLTSAEITEQYAKAKGFNIDKETHAAVTSRISAVLSRLRNQGKVESFDSDGWRKSWRLL